MLLSIPVLDLLHSQLDIGVDPLSGKLTCNIKDTPPQLPQGSLPTCDLVLILQSSPEDAHPGTLCVRASTAQPSENGPGNASEARSVPPFQGFVPLSHWDRSEHSAQSMTAESLFHTQHSLGGVDTTNITYGPSPSMQGSLDGIMNREPMWASLQEKSLQPSTDSRALSPVSQTLSMISSGSLTEDSEIYSSPGWFGLSGLEYDAFGFQADHANLTYCSPSPMKYFMDIQDVAASDYDSTSSGSISVADPFSPALFSESSSQTSSAAVSPKQDLVALDPRFSSPLTLPAAPNYGESSFSSTFRSSSCDSPGELARGGKRELYPCPFPSCGRVLKSVYTQQIHLKTHEGKPQKSFPCTMGCSESFTRHHDRLRHEVAQHGKQCEFSCKRCDRFFSSQRMLDRHTCWSWRNGSLRWQLKDSADTSRSEG